MPYVTRIKFSLRQFNDILTIIVALLAIYLMLSPFLPALSFWVDKHNGTPGKLTQQVAKTAAHHVPFPKDERLVIPSMALDEHVNTGPTEADLLKGVWHRPLTSTPDKGGNTVIIGHRFMYSNTAVFYNLDKVKDGDSITIYWGGKQYTYQVDSVFVVSPTQVEIENNTPDSRLTLYTCTPLWTSKQRLVVQAKLTKVES